MIEYAVFGVIYTRTCPLSCRHCIIESSPKATGKMTPEQAASYIRVAPRYSKQFCFTGGEPLLYYNEILPLLRLAKELGLLVSLVTGSGWVSLAKPEIARERIRGLKEAGLDTLLMSWDDYHEEFCPPEQVELLIGLCKEYGLPHYVRGVMSQLGPNPRIEQKLVNIDVTYQKIEVLRLGSAATLPEDHFKFTSQISPGGCGTVFQPVVEPNGMVYACCGPSRHSAPVSRGDQHHRSLWSLPDDPGGSGVARPATGARPLYGHLRDVPRYQQSTGGGGGSAEANDRP
jgi:organic radical activating enzyme